MRYFFAFWLAVSVLVTPFWVQAETEVCACYCKSSGGAVLMSGGTEEDPTPDTTIQKCSDTCETAGNSFLGCYGENHTDSLPTNNLRCWTEYECTTQVSADPNTAEDTYDWGGQSTSCPSGEGECYAPQTSITLGVAIEDMTSAKGLPEYVNAVYAWLIPAAALVAVVMIMIGGMQYVIARGSPKGIDAAKSRIQHAVEGILLLMFAYTIINLFDTDLVTLPNLRPPQIRRVVYLDPTSTCEYMMAYGITITPPSAAASGTTSATACGNSGTISSVAGYVGGGATTLAVGDTCRYSACSDTLATCVASTTSSSGYACTRCANAANLSDGNPMQNAPAPSEATCASLERNDTSDTKLAYCVYYNAAAGIATESNSCTEFVYPSGDGVTTLDCTRLRDDARVGDSESCRAYDLVWTIGGILPGATSGLYSNEIDDKNGAGNDYPLLARLCSEDPCGLAPPGDTCEAFVVKSDITSVCTLPLISETPPCQALALLETANCVTGEYADAMTKLVAGEELTDEEIEALNIKDVNGTAVDFNPTW